MTPPSGVPETPVPARRRISAVIVSLNRRESLRRLLDALGQEHQVIVVDNGSKDGAAAIDEEFPWVRMVRLPKNFGLTKALNLGIRAADGDYLLLLHDDACISGESVTALADLLEAHPEVGAICPKFESGAQVSKLPTTSHPYPDWHTAGEGEFDDVECAMGAAIMLRHQFIRAMRHIDERYGNYGSDLDLCAQVVLRASKKVRIACGIKALHDAAGTGSSLVEADRVIGTVVFLGKYYGFAAGMTFRLVNTLRSVISFRWGMAKYLLSNQKLDGTHI
jgi:GT2 family glycosyltransferase